MSPSIYQTTDEQPEFDDVMRTARRWYYSAIRRIVDEAISGIRAAMASNDQPRDEVEYMAMWLRETLDDHQIVIITAMSGMALAASDNEDAFADEYGDEDAARASREDRCRAAMIADCLELLEARRDEWTVTP